MESRVRAAQVQALEIGVHQAHQMTGGALDHPRVNLGRVDQGVN